MLSQRADIAGEYIAYYSLLLQLESVSTFTLGSSKSNVSAFDLKLEDAYVELVDDLLNHGRVLCDQEKVAFSLFRVDDLASERVDEYVNHIITTHAIQFMKPKELV